MCNSVGLSKEQKDILMKEYEVTSSRADKFSTLIWQLGAIFLPLGSGGIIFVAKFEKHTISNYCTVLIVAVAVMVVISLWNQVSDRWNNYINAWYLRLQEIESTLQGIEHTPGINIIRSNLATLPQNPKEGKGIKELRHSLVNVSMAFCVLVLIHNGVLTWIEMDSNSPENHWLIRCFIFLTILIVFSFFFNVFLGSLKNSQLNK